ncbi:MAG TPA: anti-sigma factor [bacterium]|nr:anti-sigma factor [bacterium]
MKCRQFRDLIDEYMDNEMNERTRDDMDRHAGECGECRTLLHERRRLFHRLTESPEPEWEFSLADSVMTEIRRLPLPQTSNPLRRPLLIAAVTAVIISGLLMIYGLSTLPDTVSPVDVFTLMAGSIELPPGLKASIDELSAFLSASWVIVSALIQVVISVAAFILFRIPLAVPLVVVGACAVLAVWLVRRQSRSSSFFGMLF